MARQIATEVLIHAPPAQVWGMLTDFNALGDWAPFFESIAGSLDVGSRLVVKFRNGMTARPVVTEFVPGAVLEWRGKLAFRWLFDARHRFTLKPEGNATRLLHTEKFKGILVPLFGGMLRKTQHEFEAFNLALKARAESLQQ